MCRAPAQVCSRIDAIEGATALRELPGATAGLIGERPTADCSSVETLPVTGFEGFAARPSQASPPSSPSSGRASPGLKRKCSAARAESSRPGLRATVVVVNMGAGAPEASTSQSPHQSPHGSPKGAELKRPKSGVDLASLGGEGQGGEGQGGEAPASGESKAPFSLDGGGMQLFSDGYDLKRPKSVDSNLASWSKSALTM